MLNNDGHALTLFNGDSDSDRATPSISSIHPIQSINPLHPFH